VINWNLPQPTETKRDSAYSNTLFLQLLQLLKRHDFRKIEENGFCPKRKYRTLNRRGQFVVMMFAQITGRSSLRVETFFEWIKQKLNIKSFLRASRNAVMTQIWVAIITLFLLAYYLS
jgi:IS4 transposase